ncbi:MAG: hypothetical protein R3F49_17530 [Planctomycetota bacterium]
MDNGNYKYGAPLQRHLSPLKLVSRLLGHEMHVQGNVKAVSFTREQVLEIQSSIDLFIEEAARRVGGAAGMTGGGYGANGGGTTSMTPTALETTFVPTRN